MEQVRSNCCKARIRFVDIQKPLGKEKAPYNIIIIWCEGCGTILNGNGGKTGIKINEI